MAILKMKKLRLMVVRSKKDALLRELIRLGCVEFSEPEAVLGDAQYESIVRPQSSQLMSCRTQQAALLHAVELLNKYAPAKGKLLGSKPELEAEELLSEEGLDAARELAEELISADDRLKRIAAEESRLRGLIEAMEPWLPLALPLDTEGTARCSVLMGSIPAKLPLKSAEDAVAQVTEEAEVFLISEDKNQRYIVTVCMREDLPAIQESLRQCSFTASANGGISATAKQCKAASQQELKKLAEEKDECLRSITDKAQRRDELKLAADKLSAKINLCEAEEMLCGTESTLIMEGWMPAEREEKLSGIFDRYDCAWECTDPAEDEYPKVPVELKNNKFTDALNMVTNMYSLPAYGTVDANPLMAPFFLLFYGLMMADMGYGIIMILAAIVALKAIKPKAGTLSFCRLLLYGGISTFIFGALTGGFFGDAPYRIVHMFNPESTWQGLPYLFSPVNDSNMVLYGSMVLGFIHLNTGMAVSFIQKKRSGNLAAGIFEEGPMWVIFLGGAMAALKLLGITEALATPGLIILGIGVVMLLYGAGREAKGIGKITAAFGCIYNTLTGWFGDILSYSRIMALMLAGGVVGQVFNTIAAMPADNMGPNAFSVAVFFLIFIIGHLLNFGLNLLGCFVHDLRLQCLEFFGKFYSDGGKPFRPLRFTGKFINAKEN